MPAMIDTTPAVLRTLRPSDVASPLGVAILDGGQPWAEGCESRPDGPQGCGEAVRMGAVATISRLQTRPDVPPWLTAAQSSDVVGAFGTPMRGA
jgi:hypothetical protein